MRRSSALLLAIAAVVLVAGCTVNEAGSGTPEPTTSSKLSDESPSSGDSSTPSTDIPSPPRDLSLDGIDPCTLFTESQRAELKIDQVRSSDGRGAGTIYEGMKRCSLDKGAEEPFVGYSVIAVTDVDVSFWLTQDTNADAKLIDVGGYPAAEFHLKGGGNSECAVAVGVAKNQHLHVEMAPISDGITGDAICQGSKQAAEMALQTLQTMR